MAVTSRRFIGQVVRLVGRPWNQVTGELQQFLQKIVDSVTEGIPGGFSSETPTTINAGDSGTSGLETAGWSSAGHEHPVSTATAAGLANTSSEGTSTALSRADHAHKRDIRVAFNGSDVGTRNRINFTSTGTSPSDDVGNDEVDVPIASAQAAEDAEVLAWVL